MAKKPKEKRAKEPAPEGEAGIKPGGSRKLLLAAALMCIVSLGGGFFLARFAYLQDAAEFEPEYKDEEVAAEEHGEDGHGADEEGGHGEEKKDAMRTDITDPLAKDGHEAASANSLHESNDKSKSEILEGPESGLLVFGDMTTNIEGLDAQGGPTRAFLKINLVLAYRADEGATELLEERQPFMRDLFNTYLRGLSESDVRGMAGILYIKAELLKRARAAVGNDLPQEILISDLIVQ